MSESEVPTRAWPRDGGFWWVLPRNDYCLTVLRCCPGNGRLTARRGIHESLSGGHGCFWHAFNGWPADGHRILPRRTALLSCPAGPRTWRPGPAPRQVAIHGPLCRSASDRLCAFRVLPWSGNQTSTTVRDQGHVDEQSCASGSLAGGLLGGVGSAGQ